MSVLERILEQETAVEEEHNTALFREKMKQDLIDRLGLEAISSMVAESARGRQELEVACQAILNQRGYESLSVSHGQEVVAQVLDEIVGLGPLQPLLDDDTVTEVMVNGCEQLFYERAGEIHATERVFESEDQILLVIDRILAPLGRRLDRSSPIVNARLANGDRVNAVAQPIAIDGPVITIRKFSNRITTLQELVERGSLPRWYAQLLSWAVLLRKDIAVAGGTGSGKTTLLNALSCEIGLSERIITIEDSAELKFNTHPDVVRLEARDASIEGTGEVTIRDLVKNALRMRPDRIVVGECRGEETIDMLQAMNTGHDGSLTTLHAGTAEEAVLRLVLMSRFGMDLPTEIIEEQIASALDFIVLSRRMGDGSRFITSMSAVGRKQGGGICLDECVSFDQTRRTWSLCHEPKFVEQAVEDGVLTLEEVELWRQSISS
ncbi:MAG: CpaF family protein [Atopobiaceae bacterium]|jgi:pilus assembly protein CpaF